MTQTFDLAQALQRPEAYPFRPKGVDFVQTHVSMVFLTGDVVYKVKKPVDFGFLDFTTLEKRRYYCEREVELNRRLAPDVYLGVVPIVRTKSGVAVEGKGQAIDYAVKMRQLPQERFMDKLLAAGQVSPDAVRRIAALLVDFHQRAATSPEIASYGGMPMTKTNCQENFDQTAEYIGRTISQAQYDRIKAWAWAFIERHAALFTRRVEEGHIRDCHGDLHTAQICLQNGIYITDCIEFNDRFRYTDTAKDMAFLAMDLDAWGRGDLSKAFVDEYVKLTGDFHVRALLPFYKCYFSYVRGKVQGFQSVDPHETADRKARLHANAARFFALAERYTHEPFLFITTGLLGSGKTTVAQTLTAHLGLEYLSSDIVRKELVGMAPTERSLEGFRGGIYAPEHTAHTYEALFQGAKRFLAEGHSVVLDASFRKRAERLQAKALAEEVGAELHIIECVLDETIAKERLERRMREGTSPSDGRWEIYQDIKRDYEPVTEAPPGRRHFLNTAQHTKSLIDAFIASLGAPEVRLP